MESDRDWLLKGVDRVLSNHRSGRDFLQSFQLFWAQSMQVGPYFEKLASPRRLAMVAEGSGWLRAQVEAVRTSSLAEFSALDAFEVSAGEGHYLEAATHDPVQGETPWPTGHFFALHLKSQSRFPLTLADWSARKKEHAARALKRQRVAPLRQGAGQRPPGAVGVGQGGREPAVLAGTQSLGHLLFVPAQSRDVFGTGTGTEP